jgi:CBS domain-containing membrane protein
MHASDPVNRFMSEPVLTIGPDEPIRRVLQLFMAHPVHHLPVVEERRVVGMLSSADVMKLEFFLPPPGPAVDALLNERWRIKEIMRSPVICVTEHETVQRAAELMAVNGVHALPVVNSNDELIGIITTTDIMYGCLKPTPEIALPDRRGPTLTEQELAAVLAAARRAVSTGHDSYRIAAALLAMQQRVRSLEQVAMAAKRYLNAGQEEGLHTSLRKEIERADRLNSQ